MGMVFSERAWLKNTLWRPQGIARRWWTEPCRPRVKLGRGGGARLTLEATAGERKVDAFEVAPPCPAPGPGTALTISGPSQWSPSPS